LYISKTNFRQENCPTG